MAAIYQWFVGSDEIHTTTLYPIETAEGLTFSTDLYLADLIVPPIVEDSFTITQDITGAQLVTVLIVAPTVEDAFSITQTIVSCDLVQVLIEASPVEDAFNFTQDIVSASLLDILITAYCPDHGLATTIDLDTTNTTLT